MKVVFIYEIPHIYIREPLGVLYLVSSLKKAGHDSRLYFSNLERNIFKKIKQMAPDVICYSVATGFEKKYLYLNNVLKREFDFFSIFGGPHPTFFNDFIYEKGVDAICIGEGEEALVEVINRLQENKGYTDVKNFWFKVNGEIIKNSPRPLIAALDELPFPDRTAVFNYFKGYIKKDMMVSRGCYYNCSYCFNRAYKHLYNNEKDPVRFRGVDSVIEEIKIAKSQQKLLKIWFIDDIFPSNLNWLEEFSCKYKKQINLPFQCYSNPININKNMLAYLKEAGCIDIWMGIESGNEHLREQILGRKISNAILKEAAALINENNINLFTFNMLGLPEESVQNAFETLELNLLCRPKYAWVSLLQPYPGTVIYDYVKDKKLMEENKNIEGLFHSSTLIKLKDKKQIINLFFLFSIIVSKPFLKKISGILIKLPLTPLYKFVYILHKVIVKVKFNIEEFKGFGPILVWLYIIKNRKHRQRH